MTEQRRKQLAIVAGILVLFFGAWELLHLRVPWIPGPWPLVFWAGSIEGQVLDADTGTPLKGVVVTARWGLRAPYIGSPAGLVMVLEAVTDEKGRYTIPWWGPRLRWPLLSFIGGHEPVLLVFKTGYGFLARSNFTRPDSRRGRANYGVAQHSVWDGEVIRLKKFVGSQQEYTKHIGDFYGRVAFAFEHKDCSWREIPHMLATALQEKARLNIERGYTHLNQNRLLNDLEERAHSSWCGSLKDYLREYLK